MNAKDFNNLIMLSLVCILIATLKATALIQYWQQSRHVLLFVDTTVWNKKLPWRNLETKKIQVRFEQFNREFDKRMIFAGQILLNGSDAIPKPMPLIVKELVPRKCPVATKSACPTISQPSLEKQAVIEKQLIAEKKSVTDPLSETASLVKSTISSESASVSRSEKLLESEKLYEPEKLSGIEKTDEIKSSSEPAVQSDVKINSTQDVKQNLENKEVKLLPAELTSADIEHPVYTLARGEKVLLIGDSMMQGVAPHLAYLLRKKHGVESLDLGTKSSGLTYPGFFDWPAHVEEEFNKEHYAALVVLLGANDTWDMVQTNHYIKFASDLWRELYVQRIDRIILAAETQHIKVVWLSAPPMGRGDIADRIPVLNDIIQKNLEKHGSVVRFVSTAEPLTLDGKTFSRFIEVPERGSVMVRTDDGIHFTPFGQELIAKLVISQFVFAPTLPSQLSAQ